MQNIVEAEAQEKKYVRKLWRPHGFDHNVEWVPEVFAYYESHPELKQNNLIRFAISLPDGIDQNDNEQLGIKRLTEAQWGMEGLLTMAPLKTLQDRGIPFHIEGGGPRSPPLDRIHQVVTRLDEEGRVIGADQALTRETAFLGVTRWAARFIGAENVMGSIKAGHLADLVVFDGDIMNVPIEKLIELKPVMTLVGGQVAFEATGL
jgi:predicted amidohydrolase YtcJ